MTKWKSFLLLTLIGGLLFTVQTYWPLEVLETTYFFLGLLSISLIMGVDLLTTLLKLFDSSWNNKGVRVLKSWQTLRFPLGIFVILGLSSKFSDLSLHSGYFSLLPFLGRQLLYLLFMAFYPKLLWRTSYISSLFSLFLGNLLLTNLFFIDWGMLLFSPWHSTMFPLLMSTVSLSGGVGALLWHRGKKAYKREEIYEMGRLGITALFFTLYLQFGQFLISWQARLPIELKWYELRTVGAMGFLCLIALLVKYLMPLVLLFLRERIPHLRPLALSGRLIIVGFILEIVWIYRIF